MKNATSKQKIHITELLGISCRLVNVPKKSDINVPKAINGTKHAKERNVEREKYRLRQRNTNQMDLFTRKEFTSPSISQTSKQKQEQEEQQQQQQQQQHRRLEVGNENKSNTTTHERESN
jgi:hypothetical protein